MCQTKDVPIRDWVKLAVNRARATGDPAVFWLDETRPHDANLIAKVRAYLPEHDTDGLQIEIMAPEQATAFSLERIRRGENTISVTGQRAARLPDRPVPDPGARHERQDAVGRPADRRRRHVRDRRRRLGAEARPAAAQGELPALGQPGRVPGAGGQLRAPGADVRATRAPRSWPTRSTGPPARSSTRTSRRAAAWAASTIAAATSTWRCTGPRSWPTQTQDPELAAAFAGLAKTLAEQEQVIADELIAVQGSPTDIGGYYQPDPARADGGHAPVEDLQRRAREPRSVKPDVTPPVRLRSRRSSAFSWRRWRWRPSSGRQRRSRGRSRWTTASRSSTPTRRACSMASRCISPSTSRRSRWRPIHRSTTGPRRRCNRRLARVSRRGVSCRSRVAWAPPSASPTWRRAALATSLRRAGRVAVSGPWLPGDVPWLGLYRVDLLGVLLRWPASWSCARRTSAGQS